MTDFSYLYQGLCAMSKAHKANTMAGHLGAATVAGYFFGEDQGHLDVKVNKAITGELDRIIDGEEGFWYQPKKAGISINELFSPLAKEDSQKEQIDEIATALSANINKTRQSGHNVIFASIALRALHDHPEFATPAMISGIRKLIEGFNGAHPGRGYYGKKKGWINGDKVALTADNDFPPYSSEETMAEVVVDHLITSAAKHRQGFGGFFHIINHANALTELSALGYKQLARQGLAGHHHHLRLYLSLPDLSAELGTLEKANHDPRTPEYWNPERIKSDQWSAWLTHRIKTLYGFFNLLEQINDPSKKKAAEQQFLYLMA